MTYITLKSSSRFQVIYYIIRQLKSGYTSDNLKLYLSQQIKTQSDLTEIWDACRILAREQGFLAGKEAEAAFKGNSRRGRKNGDIEISATQIYIEDITLWVQQLTMFQVAEAEQKYGVFLVETTTTIPTSTFSEILAQQTGQTDQNLHVNTPQKLPTALPRTNSPTFDFNISQPNNIFNRDSLSFEKSTLEEDQDSVIDNFRSRSSSKASHFTNKQDEMFDMMKRTHDSVQDLLKKQENVKLELTGRIDNNYRILEDKQKQINKIQDDFTKLFNDVNATIKDGVNLQNLEAQVEKSVNNTINNNQNLHQLIKENIPQNIEGFTDQINNTAKQAVQDAINNLDINNLISQNLPENIKNFQTTVDNTIVNAIQSENFNNILDQRINSYFQSEHFNNIINQKISVALQHENFSDNINHKINLELTNLNFNNIIREHAPNLDHEINEAVQNAVQNLNLPEYPEPEQPVPRPRNFTWGGAEDARADMRIPRKMMFGVSRIPNEFRYSEDWLKNALERSFNVVGVDGRIEVERVPAGIQGARTKTFKVTVSNVNDDVTYENLLHDARLWIRGTRVQAFVSRRRFDNRNGQVVRNEDQMDRDGVHH